MKFAKFSLVALLGLLISLYSFSQTTNVMFIGNSYTAANQMPSIFESISLEAGDSVFVDGSVIGGYTLGVPGSGHLYNDITISMIKRGYWNFVILQEQSQMPTIPFYRDGFTYPAADSLNTIIQENNPCAQTVFYMTWGRKYGGEQCIGSYCSPVFVDYFHMQDSLASAYMYMTLSNNALCAPVGISWSNSITNGDPIDLFAADASHPSLAGSYLAACTFYAAIFQKSPVGITYNAGLTPDDALYLQQLAEATVLTDPEQWNIFPPVPISASFTYDLDESQASFTNTSVNASLYLWDFGDPITGGQNTSSLENPTHHYSGPGTFIVTLSAGDGCRNEIAVDTIVIMETGIRDLTEDEVKIFPNPVINTLSIDFMHTDIFHTYSLINLDGKQLMNGELNIHKQKAQIKGLSVLPAGVYLLVLTGENSRLERKILISN